MSPNVSSGALAQISTAVAVDINAELILEVLAAPIAFNIVVKVARVVKQLESLLTVLSIGIEIVAEIHGVAVEVFVLVECAAQITWIKFYSACLCFRKDEESGCKLS